MVHHASTRIREAVLGWKGVEERPHRFGGLEYRLGNREIGHVHGDQLVDFPFPKRIRDEIVAAGQAQPHHILPQTGWVSFYIRGEQDVSQAINLLHRSYEIALKQRGGPDVSTPDG